MKRGLLKRHKKTALLVIVVLLCSLQSPLFSFGTPPQSDESDDELNSAILDEENESLLNFENDSGELSDEEMLINAFLELDDAFSVKSDALFSSVLKKYSTKEIYYLVEDYSKKQINRFIIDGEFGFVLSTLYILIDTNIDAGFEDDEAIEMYYTIYESYALQRQEKSKR